MGGTWTQEQRFNSPVYTGRDRFGASVKLIGDVAIVGAPRTPPPVSGLAVTFQRTLDRKGQPDWASQQVILAPDPLYHDQFGVCIAVHGTSVMIGAQNHAEKGDAYSHQISDAELKFTDQLSASDGKSGDLFSSCIAMTAQHIALGAWGCDEAGFDAGAVYVFNRTMLGDITSNCVVDVDDLLDLINDWGPCAPPCPSDFDGNGVVDVDDLLIVINNWS